MITTTNAKKVWHLLGSDHRRAAMVLWGYMFIGMALETLGIGLAIPAVALMTQSDFPTKSPFMAVVLNMIGNPGHDRLIVIGMLSMVAVYTVKVLFLAFLAWRQAKFIFTLESNLSQRLFYGYLYQPYTFHLRRNSAQLIRNTIGQVAELAGVVNQSLILVTEILVLIGISILLLSVETVGALFVISIIGLAGWGFHRFTRYHILRWGKARQLHEGLRIQHLQQGFGGAKDIKLLGREGEFIEQYRLHNSSSTLISARQATLTALPRLWLELLAVTGLAVLVSIMVLQGKPTEALLPTLGLFAAAAFRVIPSVNRTLSAVQSIRYYLPVIDSLHEEVCLLDTVKPPWKSGSHLLFKRELTLEHITFSYPSSNTPVISDISLSIPRDSSVGIIGDSGAGKSTIVDIILGLLTPDMGTIKIDGIDIQTNLRGWQDQIGYVPQTIYLTDDTIRRNVAFGLPNDKINDSYVWNAICSAQLEQFVNGLPKGLDTLVGERGIRLSGGQRQRIGIARALYHSPSVLVLDEATSSLDTETERGVMDAVSALKGDKTLIIVAHRLTTVEHCDRLFRFKEGKIVQQGETAFMLGMEGGRN